MIMPNSNGIFLFLQKKLMDIFWLILAAFIILIGLVGAILPGIPGPITSFVGLLLALFSSYTDLSHNILFVLGVIAIILTVIDYVMPIYGTKQFGGTRAGIIGSIIGLFAGLILIPGVGIIIGPLVGAFIGELIAGANSNDAFKAALGSFIGFLTGTFMKLIYSIIIVYYFVAGLL
jgi:uncharacterized protein YqgC (DUF456 family)